MRERHALVLDELEQQLGLIAAGIDLFGARRGRRIGKTPGVHMKHRRDRHIDAFGVEAPLLRRKTEGGEFGDRVQRHLAMAEIDAFRPASGAARVERRRLGVFVKIRKIEFGGRRGEHVLVVSCDAALVDTKVIAVRHHDDCLDLGQSGADGGEEINEILVDKQRRSASVLDRVDDLLVRQTHIHRLQDRAHHRNGEERLEEAVCVPIEHSDRVAGAHAEAPSPLDRRWMRSCSWV